MSSTEAFYAYLLHQKNYSIHTVNAYRRDLLAFEEYLNSNYENIPIEDADDQIIRSWLASLMENGLKATSIKRKKAALTTLFKFFIRQGIVKNIPTRGIRTPKPEKRLPAFIPESRMLRLFETDFFSIEDFEDLCQRMILETLYATGMRVSELVSLSDMSFDLNNGNIKVMGKRNKERLIPIHQDFQHMIRHYLNIREKAFGSKDGGNWFFLTKLGKKIYRKFVYRVIFSYLSTVTSMKKKGPHVLRHTFATHLLNEGADINAIKDMLGHSSLAATQFYTHNTIEQLKNVYKNTHPKSQKRRKS